MTNWKDVLEALEELKRKSHGRLDDLDSKITKIDGVIVKISTLKRDIEDELEAQKSRIEGLEAKGGQPDRAGSKPTDRMMKAFGDYLRKPRSEEAHAKMFSIAGGEATGAGMVPEVIGSTIWDKAVNESPILGEITVTPSPTGDYTRITNRKGSSSGWAGELDTRNASNTSKIREIKPVGGEVYAYPIITSWMLQDSRFDPANIVLTDAGEEFGTQMEGAVLYGNGVNKPYGLLNTLPVATADTTPDTRDKDTLKFVQSAGSPNALDGDLLIDALFDLRAPYRRNAIWVMNSLSLAVVRKLKDSQGRYLWQPNLGAAVDSSDGTLLGKRVVIAEQMQTAGSGNVGIMVGDFRRGYEAVAVGNLMVTEDNNITAPGFVKFYIRRRFLGRIADNDAIRAVKA